MKVPPTVAESDTATLQDPHDAEVASKQLNEKHIDMSKVGRPKPEVGEWYDERGRRTYLTNTTPPVEPKWSKYIPGAYNQKRLVPLKGKSMNAAILAFAGIAIIFYGYDQGVMSFVNTSTDFKVLMGINGGTQRDAAASGGITAVYYGGTLIGALAGGSLGDRIGRVRSILVACIFATLGAALQTSAQNITWMTCSRVVSGLGTGVLNVVVPVLIAELSRHDNRGFALAVEFVVNILGVVIAYFLGFGLKYASNRSPSFQWRFPLAFQICFIIGLLCTAAFFPESPRWLAKMGRTEEARYILALIRTEDTNLDDPEVTQELYDICEIVHQERELAHLNNYKAMMFGTKGDHHHLRRRTWLVIWLQIMQELTGIGAVTVFAPTVFGQAGYSQFKGDLLSGINDITYTFSVLIAVFTLDRIGRKVTLYWGALVQGFALLIAGIAAQRVVAGPASQQAAWGAVVVTFVFIYTAGFGSTWLTVPWLYPTEIQPLFVRAKGGAMSVFGWSIGNGVIIMLTPFLFDAIGFGTFILFAGLNFATIPFIFFLYPETNKRTLEEMDILFSSPSVLVHNQERELKQMEAADPELFHAVKIGDRKAVERKQSYRPSPTQAETQFNEYSADV